MKVPKSVAGRISVRAVDTFRQSGLVSKRFRRLSRPPSRFRTPKHCKVRHKKVICRRA